VLSCSEDFHKNIPDIKPVFDGKQRPFWSIMIPTYNCSKYLEKTLKSILRQDIGLNEMQIEVIDDCSTIGNPEEIVDKVGKGRIKYFRQSQNAGLAKNFNTCITRSRGQWVHILHDDDILLEGYYAAMKDIINLNDNIDMIFCRAIAIDGEDEWKEILYSPPAQSTTGLIEHSFDKLIIGNYIVTSSVVIKRNMYETIGGFNDKLSHTTDWDMWLRIALSGNIFYMHRPYLLRRVHDDADTNKLAKSAENIRQIINLINYWIHNSNYSNEKKEQLKRQAYINYSNYADFWRGLFHSKGLHNSGLKHAVWAVKLHPTIKNIFKLLLSTKRYLISLR